MLSRFHYTLKGVFAFSLLGLLLSLALLFLLIFDGSKQTILQSSDRLRDAIGTDVAAHVAGYLDHAPQAVAQFEKKIRYGLIDPSNPASIQPALLSLLLADSGISETTFTYAQGGRFGSDGGIQVAKPFAGQVAVVRQSGNGFATRTTRFDGKQFVSRTTLLHELPWAGTAPLSLERPAADPTDHLTFRTPASQDYYGKLLWTDLHWSQLDDALPKADRRVELSVLKTVENSRSQFAGVLRIGLLKQQIDNATKVLNTEASGPHVIFLCDKAGQLITGFGSHERIMESGNDLRAARDGAPAQVVAALSQPALGAIDENHQLAVASFEVDANIYLCTFKALPKTQDWIVGIVVPRNYYLGSLLRIQREVLWASFAVITIIIAVGSLILHGIGNAHSLIVRQTTQMNAFNFAPASSFTYLRDFENVLAGLEKAKTAMRSMGKYVPVDLVRRLYQQGREPRLGAESIELSVLFTDIRGFTSFAEETPPDKVADTLGRYLQVMTKEIQSARGTIDKYIGDSVMAFWNAPELVQGHEIPACRAALQCRDALSELFESPAWEGLPRFVTRFGLHRCFASVGHFGAPDRFNYTAIGDGVNLASRLEGLNDYYGTVVIASEAIYSRAKELFEFRLLDKVSVKGKVESVNIYELLETRVSGKQRRAVFDSYEQAFGCYLRADFEAALSLLEKLEEDVPSRMLAIRCREFLDKAPPMDWDGSRVFKTK